MGQYTDREAHVNRFGAFWHFVFPGSARQVDEPRRGHDDIGVHNRGEKR